MDNSFRIITIRQIEAHFALNFNYKFEDNKAIEIKHRIEISSELKSKTLKVLITFISNNDSQPFHFTVVWEGIFLFKEEICKESATQIANINCAAIIFPYIRESVADLTRRANIPPFHICPINFVALNTEREAKTKKSMPKSKVNRAVKAVKNP